MEVDMIRIAEIRERVARSEYEVDPRLVAAAILERLLAGRTVEPESAIEA